MDYPSIEKVLSAYGGVGSFNDADLGKVSIKKTRALVSLKAKLGSSLWISSVSTRQVYSKHMKLTPFGH